MEKEIEYTVTDCSLEAIRKMIDHFTAAVKIATGENIRLSVNDDISQILLSDGEYHDKYKMETRPSTYYDLLQEASTCISLYLNNEGCFHVD